MESEKEETVLEESTESAFDASSFVGDNEIAEQKVLENVSESIEDNETETLDAVESEEEEEINTETTKEISNDDETTNEEPTFDWNDSEEADSSTETDDSNNTEEDKALDFGDSWQTFAEDLGIKVESFDEFKDVLSHQQALARKSISNDAIVNLSGFANMSDEELMRAELKAQNYESHEIDDEIDLMVENGTIKSAARKVRKDVEGAIQIEQEKANATIVNPSEAKLQEQQEALSHELKEYMSKTDSMFSGKINSTQKDEHFKYIDSGEFFDDITDTSANVAQAAWLWKHRDKIMKGFLSKGVERGKQAVLDDLRNPERTRSNRIPDPETGDFNSTKFLDLGESM